MMKRIVSFGLILCMFLTCMITGGFSVSAQDSAVADDAAVVGTADSGADYGLPKRCEDGNILQCFNWTLAQIKQELPNIAQAGFTCVQTSPLQSHDGNSKWYWLYQPNGFTIGNELGSYDDLKSLCAEADKYGVKIIVDVVSNHLAGSNSGTLANSVESVFKTNKSTYFHNLGAASNWDNRYEVTQKNIGMPDLNSENTAVQNMVYAMLVKLKDAGVDGIRWDAAKHIALPSENCAFWSKMAQIGLYQYGEILDAPAGKSSDTVNNALMNEYAQYIGVSDDKYSSGFTAAVRDGQVYRTNGYWTRQGLSADRIVYWAESHDTYSNTSGWTKNIDQNVIDRAYAILGARANSQALYLSRPSDNRHEYIYYAKKGSTHFTSKEVAQVNRFHNAMVGTDEKYLCTTKYYAVLRSRGAVIATAKTSDVDVTVTNSNAMVPVGTYIDRISGNTFTVTEKQITGHLGSTGIAVIYNDEPSKEIMIGDTDLNEKVEIYDANMIQRSIASLRELTKDETAAADADQNDAVTVLDVTEIQWYLAQMKKEGSRVGQYITR